MYKSKGVETL